MKGRISVFLLSAGLIVLLTAFVPPLFKLTSIGGTGIIGGADTPTYKLLFFSLWGGSLPVLASFGAALALSAVFCIIFSKTVGARCSLLSSAIALGMSASTALGLVCLLVWTSITAFHETARYPVEHTVSVMLGFGCFTALTALAVLYFYCRRGRISVVGTLIDVLTCLLWIPPFFLAFACLWELIG